MATEGVARMLTRWDGGACRAERAGWGGRTTRRRLAASKSSDSGAEPETPAAAETPAAEETTTDTATVPPAAEAGVCVRGSPSDDGEKAAFCCGRG